jgi:hypothetical protein
METPLIMFKDKCPLCGTHGRLWHKDPEVFVCPHCSSFFSKFGLVLGSEEEMFEMWA